MEAAIAILSARETLPSPELRVMLVLSLELAGYVGAAAVPAETGSLLSLLLSNGIVEDSGAIFEAFAPAGWDTIEAALGESNVFSEIASPKLLADFVPQALASNKVPEPVKLQIIQNLEAYAPSANEAALRAAGAYASRRSIVLPVDEIERIATVTQDPAQVVSLLAVAGVDASTIVRVFGLLPPPYSHLATRARSEFEVDDDRAHRKVIGTLDSAGVATSTKVRLKDRRTVKLR
jgi:hypothetical protein